MSLKRHIVRQFAKPTGLLGNMAGRIMARRTSNRIRNARTVEMMHLTPNMRVLEIGCGPGLALLACARAVDAGRVIGLDHSKTMITQSRARLAAENLLNRVELVTGGIEELDRTNERFDRIFSLNVIQFIADKQGFFGKIHTLLAPGGMCFTTYQPRLEQNVRAAVESQVEAIVVNMRSAGFEEIDIAEILTSDTAAVCVSGARRD